MAIYRYRCVAHGVIDRNYPMGSAPAQARCDRCPADAKRIFSAPALATTSPFVSMAVERQARSAESPDVVRRRNDSSGSARRTDPRISKLPRP